MENSIAGEVNEFMIIKLEDIPTGVTVKSISFNIQFNDGDAPNVTQTVETNPSPSNANQKQLLTETKPDADVEHREANIAPEMLDIEL